MQPSVTDRPNAIDLDMCHEIGVDQQPWEVSFQNVSFSYESNCQQDSGGLREINFTVASGETVAFVGASGSGKR